MANISAIRALARASASALACALVRIDTAERLRNPTAISVRRIISESVTTKAKPWERICGSSCRFISSVEWVCLYAQNR